METIHWLKLNQSWRSATILYDCKSLVLPVINTSPYDLSLVYLLQITAVVLAMIQPFQLFGHLLDITSCKAVGWPVHRLIVALMRLNQTLQMTLIPKWLLSAIQAVLLQSNIHWNKGVHNLPKVHTQSFLLETEHCDLITFLITQHIHFDLGCWMLNDK